MIVLNCSRTAIILTLSLLLLNTRLFSQVNLQTGSAAYDYPIYTFQDNISRLSFPVSLAYNSGYGLKVDEVATDVGQGWGLIAGGRIVRQQVGEPDDQVELTGDSRNITKYPAGYLYTNEHAYQGVPINFNKYPVFKTQNVPYKPHNKFVADREVDYFHITLLGMNATFVLSKGSNQGVFLGQTLMKIRFETASGGYQNLDAGTGLPSQRARTVITRFILTDENGLEYTFEKKAYARILKTVPTDRSFVNKVDAPKKYRKHQVYYEANQIDPNAVNPYIVTEWHLTSITDKLVPGRSIQLSYSYRNMDMWMGIEANYVKSTKEYGKLISRRSVVSIPVLTGATCPNSYSISFGYNAQQRHDLPGAYALNNIAVTYNGRFVQKHILNHSYVILTRYGTPKTDIERFSSRLYLLGVTKSTADLTDVERPTTFDYHLGGTNTADFVPPPFHIAKDIWGYFNGLRSIVGNDAQLPTASVKEQSITLGRMVTQQWYNQFGGHPFINFNLVKRICFHDFNTTAIKTNFARNGLLKSISYPTGGQLVYDYSQNTGKYFGETGSDFEVGGVKVNKTTVYDGGYSNNCSSGGIQTTYDYKLSTGASSFWGAERPENSFQTTVSYRPYVKRYRFPTGCKYDYQYPGIQQIEYASSINGFQKFMSSGAGKTISVVSNIYSIFTTVRTSLLIAAGGTAGTLAIVSAVVEIIWLAFDFVFSCLAQDDWRDYTTTIKYNYDLKSTNPLPLLYKRVEVIEGTGTNGRTINEFTSDSDYKIWVPNNPLFVRQQRFAPWAYGLLKKVTVLNGSGKKVSETENFYSLVDSCTSKATITTECYPNKIPINIESCNALSVKTKSERANVWESATFIAAAGANDYTTTSNTDGLRVNIYNLYTGRTQVDYVLERTYDDATATRFTEKKTRYYYNTDNFLPEIVEEVSASGRSIVTETKYYIYGLGSSGAHNQAVTKLVAANIFTTVESVKTLVRNSDAGDESYYSTPEAYGAIKLETPYYTIAQNGAVKVSHSTIIRTTTPVVVINTLPSVVNQRFYYDNEGVLTGTKDEANRSISQISDFHKQLVVATAVNVNPDPSSNERIAYTSFESLSGSGGWDWSKAGTQGVSVTGKLFFSLAGGASISTSGTTFPTQHTMKLTLWSTGSGVTITGISSGATPALVGPTRKGFTYYEYNIQPSGGKITITGTSSIDEVRLYPAKGRMTTHSYDPIIGKIADCDQNNRVTYYEYDSKGRIRLIKDDEGSIVKMYEYNDKQRMEKCPNVYYSNAVFQLVQRNTCTGDFIGGFVEYTLPPGAYTSNVSQEHADLLADAAVELNAQVFANLNAPCIPVYYNTAKSEVFTKQGCDENYGYTGSSYTYSVPARKYFSLISLEDANDQRDEEIEANGQTQADINGTCVQITTAQWEGIESTMRCKTVSGSNTGQTEMQYKDMNPFSSTYNQTRWEVVPDNPLNCTTTPAPCPGNHWKRINGVCEEGVLYSIRPVGYSSGSYLCNYYYSFIDGSVFIETVSSPFPCEDVSW